MAPMPPSRETRAHVWFSVFAGAFTGVLAGQSVAHEPIRVAYECTEADADAFGFTCTMEDPCPVFLELAAAELAGNRLIATGNLHTKTVTLYSIVLASDDDGVTWTEPHERMRSSALEQIQFLNAQNGWITGVSVDPLARNPFLLITGDGGHSWRQMPILEDTKYATVAQLYFETASRGELVLDVAQPKTVRQELYETQTGGESWELEQVSSAPIQLKGLRPAAQSPVRVRTDSAAGTFVVERANGRAWNRVASFAVHLANCE
jgi:photosystem II stability/assembly factor-like uncharacterized protein